MIARVAAVAAVAAAVVLVGLVVLGASPGYTLSADFQDSGGLVTGNQVMIGPAIVGSVQSIGLTPNGLARIKFSVDSDVGTMHQGTIARIYENSLSGIANRYIVLEPGPSRAPEIPSGGLIAPQNTYSFVSLDQLFDTLDARHPGRAARLHPRRGGEHRRQGPGGEPDTALLRAGAVEHE